jgi:hypothetical protein
MIEHKVVDAPHPLLIENNRLRAKNTYQQVQKNESGTNRIAASRLVLLGLEDRLPACRTRRVMRVAPRALQSAVKKL